MLAEKSYEIDTEWKRKLVNLPSMPLTTLSKYEWMNFVRFTNMRLFEIQNEDLTDRVFDPEYDELETLK